MSRKKPPTDGFPDRPGVDPPVGTGTARTLRADAQRNRARVLEAAATAFAADGLSVPVHEIARRAGVGTGTVSRHFPTKEALFRAIVADRVERLVERARSLAAAKEPGPAFFAFFSSMVTESATNRGLAESFAGVGFDIEAAASDTGHDAMDVLRDMLARAQKAGAVRGDVDVADVKALIVGCLAREHHADPTARNRMITIACRGLRADHA